MVLNLRPKCANPSCAAGFEWLGGGRMFRFHRHSGESAPPAELQAGVPNAHPIEHFWLCERCSSIYTLKYEPARGVMILPLWPELPAAKSSMHLPSS